MVGDSKFCGHSEGINNAGYGQYEIASLTLSLKSEIISVSLLSLLIHMKEAWDVSCSIFFHVFSSLTSLFFPPL